MIFTKRFRYRFGDIDDAGIAYYPSFFHYFHCAFEDWWSDALHTPYDTVLHEEKFGLPAVHIESDFFQPIKYGDEPDIHLGILRIGNSSVEFGYWMTLDGNDAPLCRAQITTASVNMNTMATQAIPEKWRVAFQEYLIPAGDFPAAR